MYRKIMNETTHIGRTEDGTSFNQHCELWKEISSNFSKLKIGVRLKFKVLFFTLQKSQKHYFP
jgi:hypothetical protein